MVPVHVRLMRWLEKRGELDRGLEFLPSDAEIAKRVSEGVGLKSPEFSVLVAYAKLSLKKDILASDLPDDPYFATALADYFPQALRETYADELGEGETGLVVSHGAALRVAVPAFLGWEGDPGESLGVLANCGWVVLEHSASTWTGGVERWRLTAWNRVVTP